MINLELWPHLHKDLRCDVVWRADGGVGQLPPVLFPALGSPLRVHRPGREIGKLDLRVREVPVEIGPVRFLKSGAETEI